MRHIAPEGWFCGFKYEKEAAVWLGRGQLLELGRKGNKSPSSETDFFFAYLSLQ